VTADVHVRSRGPLTQMLLSKVLPPAVTLTLILAVWQVAARSGRFDPTLVVPPTRIAQRFTDVVSQSLYWESLLQTLTLLTYGLVICVVLGTFIGVLIGRYRVLDLAFSSVINAGSSAPIPAIVPLVTAAVGYTLSAKLVVIVAVGIFPFILNSYQGVRENDQQLMEVAHSFRAPERAIWTNVVLPGALPFIIVGLRLGVVRCLIGTVVAEFFVSQGGLGYLIMLYSRRFDVASMFVPVFTFTILGLVMVRIIALLEKKLTPWHVS
jgi:ABC-type nitrate/sulfonate/bicarbonate transport system permease component